MSSSIRTGGASEQWARLVVLITGVCATPLQISSLFPELKNSQNCGESMCWRIGDSHFLDTIGD